MYLFYMSGVSYSNIAIYHWSMWYEVDMYVARIPNRGSPPAILLRESYREGGKVKNRTLANLSHWPEHKVDALARTLKGLPPKLDLGEAFEITRSLPHGHVAAVLGTARALGIEQLIDPAPSRRTRSGVRDAGGAGDRPGLQAGVRAWAAHRDGHQLAGPAAVGVPAATRMTCMRRWTGRCTARRPSKTLWPQGI